MIVINLKAYLASFQKAIEFVNIAKEVSEEMKLRIAISLPCVYLESGARIYNDVFSQHVDHINPGAFTGHLPVEALRILNVKGSLLNHSEKKISFKKLKFTVEKLNEFNLESIVCVDSIEELIKVGKLKINYIAIEPKELIGSGISVSTAKPDIIKNAANILNSIKSEAKLLCGAGIGNKSDIRKALELGAHGVLLASAFVNSKDHKNFLRDLASAF